MRSCVDEGTLQAWFDGELNADETTRVDAHLNECVHCAEAARAVEAENLILAEALSAEFGAPVPSEQLRERIDAAVAGLQQPRVDAARQSPWSGFAALFASFRPLIYASVAVMIALAAIIGFIYLKRGQPAPVVAFSPPPSVTPTVPVEPKALATLPEPASSPQYVAVNRPKRLRRSPAPEADATSLSWQEQQYQYAIARLNEAIKIQPPLRPALQVEYEYNMAEINNAIVTGRDAVKKNPRDPQAAQNVLTAYQNKIDLMNQIADARVLEK
jgi:hypothetical protein